MLMKRNNLYIVVSHASMVSDRGASQSIDATALPGMLTASALATIWFAGAWTFAATAFASLSMAPLALRVLPEASRSG
jgi:hypothetical protein